MRARRVHRQRGNTVVEFALVAVIFFTLVTTVMEFGYMFWTNLTMQHAVREGARYAIVGQAIPNQTRYYSVLQRMRNTSVGQWDRVNPQVRVHVVDSDGNYQQLGGQSFGGPGQIVVISLDCTHQVIMPFIRPLFTAGEYRFTVRATMRNEMFTPTP